MDHYFITFMLIDGLYYLLNTKVFEVIYTQIVNIHLIILKN